MDVIAIVDDRPSQRQSIARLIASELEEQELKLSVLESDPLPDLEDYVSWIQENDVCVLILDELLNEEVRAGATAVSYSGHDVVRYVRNRLPDLPQFVVATSIQGHDLRDVESEVEATIERRDFIQRHATHVTRMLRLAQSYLDRNESELSELAEISSKLVVGEISDREKSRLNAIRAKTNSMFASDEVSRLRDVIHEMESCRDRLGAAVDQLEREVKK